MTKRIIVFSDGTGNAAANVWRSNVWRMFESLNLTGSEQVARYDDGVGTSAFKPLAVLGGAFGWGLKRNVLDLYKFLCRHYGDNPNERPDIFAFGFSRGAFTIRVLLGFVNHQGLVRYKSEGDLSAQALAAYRAYRADRYHSAFGVEKIFRAIRDVFVSVKNKIVGRAPYRKEENRPVQEIRFVGVWDTVAAYGLPIEEMTIGVSKYLWPLELPDRTLSPKVKRACHALALDDERTTFHPLLWTEAHEKPRPPGDITPIDERLSQVWFSGMHSNVGGGYPDDSLAYVPLYWMMIEAKQCGLEFKQNPPPPPKQQPLDPDAFLRAFSSRDKDGRLYDSRKGLGGYYRYGPRKIYDLSHAKFSRDPDDAVEIDVPKIHESAFKRLHGANVYAPFGLPERYAVVDDNRQVLKGAANPYETPAQAGARANAQEHVWNTVWKRRVVYFLTLAASFVLVLLPVLLQTDKSDEYSTWLRPVSETLRLAGSFLPGFTKWWIDTFAANPGSFLIAAGLAVGLMLWGVNLGNRITDGMLALWRTAPAHAAPATGLIYNMRTSDWYKGMLGAMKRHIVPFVSAVVLLYLGLALLSHLSFNMLDAAGTFCRESDPASLKRAGNAPLQAEVPTIKSICWPTGIELIESERYSITLTRTSWKDGSIAVDDIAGFEIGELDRIRDRVIMFAGLPLRRVLLRPWFRPIARFGGKGNDEYFIDPPVATPLRYSKPDEITATFRARRSGELFLYVNDAVLGFPGIADVFYRNNEGGAKVEVRQVSRQQQP